MENPLYIRPCNILYALYYNILRGLLRDFYVCPLSSESKEWKLWINYCFESYGYIFLSLALAKKTEWDL